MSRLAPRTVFGTVLAATSRCIDTFHTATRVTNRVTIINETVINDSSWRWRTATTLPFTWRHNAWTPLHIYTFCTSVLSSNDFQLHPALHPVTEIFKTRVKCDCVSSCETTHQQKAPIHRAVSNSIHSFSLKAQVWERETPKPLRAQPQSLFTREQPWTLFLADKRDLPFMLHQYSFHYECENNQGSLAQTGNDRCLDEECVYPKQCVKKLYTLKGFINMKEKLAGGGQKYEDGGQCLDGWGPGGVKSERQQEGNS